MEQPVSISFQGYPRIFITNSSYSTSEGSTLTPRSDGSSDGSTLTPRDDGYMIHRHQDVMFSKSPKDNFSSKYDSNPNLTSPQGSIPSGNDLLPSSLSCNDSSSSNGDLMFPLSLDNESTSPGGVFSRPNLTSPQGSVPSGNDLLPSSPLNYEQMFPMPLEDPPAKGSKGSVPRIREKEECMFEFDDIPDSDFGSEPHDTSSLPPTPEEDKIACYFKRTSLQAGVPSRPDSTSPTGANQTFANQTRKRVSFLNQELNTSESQKRQTGG